jgi:hypothetical protein
LPGKTSKRWREHLRVRSILHHWAAGRGLENIARRTGTSTARVEKVLSRADAKHLFEGQGKDKTWT